MRKLSLIILLILSTALLSSNTVKIDENLSKPVMEHTSYGLEKTEITFNLKEFTISETEVKGDNFSKLIIPDSGSQYEFGKPDLPKISRLFAVPNKGKVTVNLLHSEVEYIDNIKIYPCQNEEDKDQFMYQENYYNTGNIFPTSIVEVSEPAIMRDVRLVSVSVNPFQYDPVNNRVIVHKNIQLEVITNENVASVNEIDIQRGISDSFKELYSSSIQNYEAINTRDEFDQPCYLFIYHSDDQVSDNLDLLVDWRHKMGYEVHKVETSLIGNSAAQIKNYIQSAYNNWTNPPDFVCLVGDASGSYSIPTEYMSGGEGDQYYARLDGNDILADVFLGRLSFGTISEFQTILSKIINYEQNPYMTNTDWYTKACLIGDPSHSGTSTIDCNLYVKDLISSVNEDFEFIENYTGGYVNTMESAINSGISYLNYRGYLGMSGWSDSNTTSLNNGYMLPVAVILTCGTGSFASGTSRSETFLRAGTPSVPKGGIASIGTATISTHTMFNNCVSGGTYHGIFADGIYNMGGALTRGKLNLFETYPNLNYDGAPVYRFSYWNNLMGEPAMPVWTDVPQNLSVSYPASVGLGTNHIEIEVTDSASTPIEGAWVTILKGDDEIFATGLTNAYGSVILDFPDDIAGEVDVTVTKHNFIPFSDEFDIVAADNNLIIDSYSINDTNGDNLINPAETASFDITLANTGSSTVSNIEATITCDQPYVTINNGSATFGTINANSTATVSEAFSITLDSNISGCNEIRLDMAISDGTSQWMDVIIETVAAPKMDYSDYTVYDTDGILNPGESADISITLSNLGPVTAQNLTGILTTGNGNITVNDNSGTFNSIPSGGQGNNNSDRFNLTVNSYMIPGSQIPFEMTLSDGSGYQEVIQFVMEIGEVHVTDPVGPDAYGYYCYDDDDTDYLKCPEYEWIEIATPNGGPGTSLGFTDWGDGGATETIDLDINFQFYGEVYDQLSICTNGWMSPGLNESESYMNWHLPGPLGPSPIIAAFWDDMKTEPGNVYYYYDATLQYVVVQWETMKSDFSNSQQTFQAIIYDSYTYPTTTGDSEIKLQYKDISNDSVGSYDYPFDHGQYATVGLEDPSATIGLEYTFNNEYPTAAKVLENEMAILFTSPPIPMDGPYLTVYEFETLSGDDAFLESGESASLNVVIENIGPEVATDVTVEISTNDSYITITQDTGSIVQINPNVQFALNNAFSFDIDANTPDQHSFLMDVNLTSTEGSWSAVIPLMVYEPNDIVTDPMQYDVVVDPNTVEESVFTITNNGDGVLQYTIRTDENSDNTNQRNLTGSYVYPANDSFTPGETTTWTIYAYNGTVDGEWIKDIFVQFPQGVNVLSTSNMVGASGGDMISNGATGSGAGIHWHGESDLGYGYLHQYQTAMATVNVEITTEIAGNLTIDYVLEGDGYGDAPHTIENSFIMSYPLAWISLDSSAGTLTSGSSDEIGVTFDTNGLELGYYYCEIIVNSINTWDTRIVPVTLHVDHTDSPEETIPLKTSLLANYPNPFNPETSIAFNLHEQSDVKLTIYNVKGEVVNILVDDTLPAANHSYTWKGVDSNGKAVATGIYFYKLDTSDYHATKKMILLK